MDAPRPLRDALSDGMLAPSLMPSAEDLGVHHAMPDVDTHYLRLPLVEHDGMVVNPSSQYAGDGCPSHNSSIHFNSGVRRHGPRY